MVRQFIVTLDIPKNTDVEQMATYIKKALRNSIQDSANGWYSELLPDILDGDSIKIITVRGLTE
jgi:hypothetical protein